MKTFRLKFIDVDESLSTSTTEAAIRGYMICRAPKGTTEATYFPYGNEKSINAMIGLQTANWPDLYEAIAFNTEYGLYISAPAGTASEYPSYYGGYYLTTKGMYSYWRVNDKSEPSYEVKCIPQYESNFDSNYRNSKFAISKLSLDSSSSSIIQLTDVDANVLQRLSYMNFIAWNDGKTGLSEGQEVSFNFSNGNIYPVVDDEILENPIGYYTATASGTYTIVFGATTPSTNANGEIVEGSINYKSNTKDVLYFDLKNIFDYSKFILTDNDGKSVIADTLKIKGDDSLSGIKLVEYLLQYGLTAKTELTYTDAAGTTKSVFVSPFTGLENRMFYRLNIKNDCFLRISQKSPNETPTLVTISDIGYDRYSYDINVKYILKEDFEKTVEEGETDKLGIRETEPAKIGTLNTVSMNQNCANFYKDLAVSNADCLIDVVSDYSVGSWTEPYSENLHSLWKYDTSTGTWTDVTPDYKTKNIYVSGPLMNSATKKAYSDDTTYTLDADGNITDDSKYMGAVHSACTNTIWYIKDTGKVGAYKHTTYQRTVGGTYPLIKDIRFNTITLSCKEEVYPGEYMSGGEWTGSLDENGVNSEGTKIFWPNVLPENSASFIEVTPVHTFDELDAIDDNGFYKFTKIVDPVGPAEDIKSTSIKGQRAIVNAVQSNIDAGTLGCAWTKNPLNGDASTTVESVFAAVINAGIVEAQQTVYDDALIFMECSGQEQFKSKLMSLRVTYHDTSTVISPKIITKAEFNAPGTITVAGRATGTAQYVGEFKMYDTYTGKYYWCQPIGDIGVNLARIMEKKLGGMAPAGTNDSQGLGGILSRAVLDKKWDFNDTALEIMDEKGINPITYDSKNGLMIQSQKTTMDPDNKSDWSYLGHTMSFDLCKREIRDNVMVKQMHKRISDYWYRIRTKQVQAILDKRTGGSDPIWDFATVEIASKNTAVTKAKREFHIEVRVRVYPYSDYVVLTFKTLAQE